LGELKRELNMPVPRGNGQLLSLSQSEISRFGCGASGKAGSHPACPPKAAGTRLEFAPKVGLESRPDRARIGYMLVDATLLIQDVQLLCFTVVFGVLAWQRWEDRTRRWLWYTFLANAAGAVFDLLGDRIPNWVGHGINLEMIPLSYALLNVALVRFEGRGRKAIWASWAILLATLPFFLFWRSDPAQVRSFALADFAIALECAVTALILFRGSERSTQAPRLLMGGFLALFVPIELVRFGVAFLLHTDPDAWSRKLEMTSAVAYIVNTSLLPLAFVWMMNARLEADLLLQTILDPLTNVLNRRGLEQALERELARYRRYGYDLTVAILDLDHFKQLNDSYGHVAGDSVLTEVATQLVKRLRGTDQFGRFGGEEFVLILPHSSVERSGQLLESLCEALREYPFAFLDTTVRATASFGATNTYGRKSPAAQELLHEADVALYQAKTNGRDQVCFFTPVAEAAMADAVDR
jgi:diguanylate cyclase (GGDEF)-like protein